MEKILKKGLEEVEKLYVKKGEVEKVEKWKKMDK